MAEAKEGEGESETDQFTDIEPAVDCLDSSVIFHVAIDVLGFVLYMHQQIPSLLQDISAEFEGLQTECKDLIVLAQTETKASMRRIHAGKLREVKHDIKRLEKAMKTVYSLRTALQLLIADVPDIERVILLLGGSPLRPRYIYELCFHHAKVVSGSGTHGGVDGDFTKSRAAEILSRKAIRTLISKGAGSDSYAGPTKLFLLVKAPSTLNMPLHFLPKREFKFNKKIRPFRLRFKDKNGHGETDCSNRVSQTTDSVSLKDQSSDDFIWFQCRHVIKGLPCPESTPEE